MIPKFQVHDLHDNVGVAVEDIKAGETLLGVLLEDTVKVTARAGTDIPLGHKIALADLSRKSH